jgi:HSP20 family protein
MHNNELDEMVSSLRQHTKQRRCPMTALVRWNPAQELMSIARDMERLLNDTWDRPWYSVLHGGDIASFAVDVYQTDKEYVVEAALPGIKPEEIGLTVAGGNLTIKVDRKNENNVNKENYLLRERTTRSFCRTITLPVDVESDKTEASMEHGVLTIRIPKPEAVVPKTITIKAAQA